MQLFFVSEEDNKDTFGQLQHLPLYRLATIMPNLFWFLFQQSLLLG